MLKKLAQKVPFFNLFAILIFLNTGLIITFVFLQKFLPPVIPLFYGLPKGGAQLAPKITIILPPLVSMVISIINLILISLTKDEFVHKLLVSICLVVTLLSTVTTIRIFLLISKF